MPFYTPSNKPQFNINFDKYKPVDVMFHTNTDGTLKPMLFKYPMEDGLNYLFKIEKVSYSKDINGGILFRCSIASNDRHREVNLVYFIKQHLWCLEI